MKRKQIVGMVLAVAVLWAAGTPSTQAAILASDTFTTNAPNGTTLVGRTTETGNLTWSTTTGAAQLWNGGVGLNNTALVPFDADLYPSFAVSADMDPNNNGLWTFLGFGKSSSLDLNSQPAPLWMALNGNDGYQLWATLQPGGQTLLANVGTTPNNVLNGSNHVRLAYDRLTTTVTLEINGVSVYSAVQTVDIGQIITAGFTGYGQTVNTPEIDNFLLEVGVPEPSTLALLGLGGFLLWRRK